MNKQTAIQDLIKELKQFKKFPMVDQPTIDAAIEFAELRLEMEKEQIIEAWQKNPQGYNHTGEQYYNEIFKTQSK